MSLPRTKPAIVLSVLVILSSLGVGGAVEGAGQSWTVMVYMANDTTSALPSVDNINAMEAAPQATGLNVVVLRDEPGDGNSEILQIEHDSGSNQDTIVSTTVDDNDHVIDSTNEVNTGSAVTLSDFITYSASTWPADRYVLILWGHGAGWDGLCLDGLDILNLTELKTGLVEACTAIGRPLDMIAVDACVEATVETLYQIRGCAHYFISAQTSIPYEGLPYYLILSDLAQDIDQDVEEFGETIVDRYMYWSSLYSQNSATLAAFNLDGLTPFMDALSDFCELGLRYDSLFHATARDIMTQSERYGTDWCFDIGDFLRLISGANVPLEVKAAASGAYRAYGEMIVDYRKFNHPDPLDGIKVTNATGAVVYAPSTSPFDARYFELDLAKTNWDEYATTTRLVAPANETAAGPQITYADTDSDGLQDEATLTWPEPYDFVTAYVFRYSPHGLTYVDDLVSSTGIIVLHGYLGELRVSAGGGNSESMLSHAELNITLYGSSVIIVEVLREGETFDAVSEEYDVRAVSTDLMIYGLGDQSRYTVSLAVPTQASMGQLIRLEVLDANGLVVAEEYTFADELTTMVYIELPPDNAEDRTDFNVLLMLSLLPGLFVLAFAIMLYIDFRKVRKRT